MSKLAAAVFGLVSVVLGNARVADAQASQDDQLAVAKAYLEARAATMQASAAAADVERALSFCTPSIVYEHPRVKMNLSGAATLRAGMLAFLGESRHAAIAIADSLQGRDMVAVRTDVTFEAKDGDGWTRTARSQTWVFEFEGHTIRRVIEYW